MVINATRICDECLHRCDVTNLSMKHFMLYCTVKRAYLISSQKTCKYFMQR